MTKSQLTNRISNKYLPQTILSRHKQTIKTIRLTSSQKPQLQSAVYLPFVLSYVFADVVHVFLYLEFIISLMFFIACWRN